MQQKVLSSMEDAQNHLPAGKNDHLRLRRVHSDVITKKDEIVVEDMKLPSTQREDDVREVECECCGMSEDCTPTYINRIKENFCGTWVCGLCAEAVKEKMKRNPVTSITEALESHANLCKQFNRTVRLNPKLSLAGTMRDIARKSSLNRNSKNFVVAGKISRTASCSVPM